LRHPWYRALWQRPDFRIWVAACIVAAPIVFGSAALGADYPIAGVAIALFVAAIGAPRLVSRPVRVFAIAVVLGCLTTMSLYIVGRNEIIIENKSGVRIGYLILQPVGRKISFSAWNFPPGRPARWLWYDLFFDGRFHIHGGPNFEQPEFDASTVGVTARYRGTTRIVLNENGQVTWVRE
jgi:hypothetical protein